MHDTHPPDLFARLKRADPVAFRELYAAEKTRLFGFLMRLTRDPHLAADLFQNTWLKLARSLHTLREGTELRAWLLTVARNEYLSHCRAQRLDLSRLFLIGLDPPDGVELGRHPSDLAHLELALGRLSDADREVLLLVGVEELESHEAAQVLGISPSALRQRLKRARDRLTVELLELDSEAARCLA